MLLVHYQRKFWKEAGKGEDTPTQGNRKAEVEVLLSEFPPPHNIAPRGAQHSQACRP